MMLKFSELNTKRLHLRLPTNSDYSYQFEYLKDSRNYPFVDNKVVGPFNDITSYFIRMFKGYLDTSLFWMICDRETDIPIGTVSAWNVNWDDMTIELGYSIYPKYRHNGYMKEALLTVITYLNKELEFNNFDIWTEKNNESSIKLAKSLTFNFVNFIEFVDEEDQINPGVVTYATYRLNLGEKNESKL